MRDFQKSKVYAAEDLLNHKTHEHLPLFRVKEFLDQIIKSKWFRKRYHVRHYDLRDGRGARIARGGPDGLFGVFIKLPRWSRSRLIILHELSHGLVPRGTSGHGREFCATYLELVKRFIGNEMHAELKAAFKEKKVKHHRSRQKAKKNLLPVRSLDGVLVFGGQSQK